MPSFRLSKRAEADLSEIADYTIETFGIDQARRYVAGLDTCFKALADNSLDGRCADEIAPGLRRYRNESHFVFYIPDDEGVFIVRLLHQSMDFQRHL